MEQGVQGLSSALFSGFFALASLVAGAILAAHVVRSVRRGFVVKRGQEKLSRDGEAGGFWLDVFTNAVLSAVLLLGAAWILSRLLREFG